ncbi:MAG: aminotransferase class V-fold PLP-dependent enzyme [Chloroflexi bacterium]|nr:aminotransferase class V-fold PLP-dependent enzyme [Chloroflexota bacterium]
MLTRADFLIRDDIVFLNHGSFGACPRPVFERYQAWQLELERQPIEFLLRNRAALMAEARSRIAEYFNVSCEDIVFVTNATAGLNIALRSLRLQPGDEILTSSHEYGAVYRLLEFVAAKTGARIIPHQVHLPYETDAAFLDAFFADASARTKAIVISHITSPSSLIFPVELICRRAREQGILTIIDGAHAPGQLPLDLTTIGADIYSGNFHKWMCAPKGSGFLHVRPEHQAMIDPLVISHGWREGSGFVERNEWGGTRDIAPFLTVPAAIDFLREHDWDKVRARCHKLAARAQAEICARYGLRPLSRNQFAQMVTIPLPECKAAAVKEQLYDTYGIEVPIGRYFDRCGVRVSVQAYNRADDIAQLVAALEALID